MLVWTVVGSDLLLAVDNEDYLGSKEMTTYSLFKRI